MKGHTVKFDFFVPADPAHPETLVSAGQALIAVKALTDDISEMIGQEIKPTIDDGKKRVRRTGPMTKLDAAPKDVPVILETPEPMPTAKPDALGDIPEFLRRDNTSPEAA
ncbi:MAG: hypothetical protein ACPGO3_15710 [Magnetospiraceae bacterium]